MTTETERPTPQQVSAMVAELDALTEVHFRQALAENLKDERPVETAAFRDPRLAFRTYAALRALLDQTNDDLRLRRGQGESTKAWQARATRFRNRVGQERRIMETIVAGLRAQQGITYAAPNPRARAHRRLAQARPQEFLALLREEQEADRQRAQEQKRARAAARRQQR